MKKWDEEKRKEEEHHKLVSRMILSAEVGAGLLHKITKPTRLQRRSASSGGGRKMSDLWPDVRRRGKSGQRAGSVTRRCKTWRTAVQTATWPGHTKGPASGSEGDGGGRRVPSMDCTRTSAHRQNGEIITEKWRTPGGNARAKYFLLGPRKKISGSFLSKKTRGDEGGYNTRRGKAVADAAHIGAAAKNEKPGSTDLEEEVNGRSLGRSTSGAALDLYLDNIARCRHDIVVALVDLLITVRYS